MMIVCENPGKRRKGSDVPDLSVEAAMGIVSDCVELRDKFANLDKVL